MWNALFAKYLEKSITKGALSVTLSDGSRRVFGEADATPVELVFHDPKLPQLVVRSPDLAIGEGYMDGRLTIGDDDLVGFMTLAVKNFGRNNDQYDHPSPFKTLSLRTQKAWRQISQYNPVGKAQANVAHHYDLSDELYDLFLDEDRQYSCAYYKMPGDTLEQAQRQKKDHIARKLRIEPGMRVLDIGCGWGGMGLTLAQDYGATVVGVTLSKEQHKVATQRVHDAGLEGQVEFRLQDYRHLSEQFDRIVSVGMFEHVGVPHYDEFFRTLRDLLSPDGVALVHTIGRAAPPNVTGRWIAKYIFPGGYIPAMSEVLPVIENTNLIATDIEIWRIHYADTLRDWRVRFEANIDKVRELYDERFCRMWRFYLVASEATFRYDRQVVFQFQLSRTQLAVPTTRDYLYPSD